MRGKTLLAPSLLSADLMNMQSSILSLEGEHDWLHVDVMDGGFVPNITFGPGFVGALRGAFPDEVLDVHLMIEQPSRMVDAFITAGADYLTVHAEADHHVHRTLSRIRENGRKAGVSINPGTSEEIIRPLLPFVDMVLVMSVNPGFGGQTFIGTMMEKVTALARWRAALGLSFLIEIDGGVGRQNAAMAARGGCDVLVMGSAVFGTPDPASTLREIRNIVEEADERA